MSTADGGQQVSRPLQILLGVVVGLAALYALWTFVLSPLLGGDDDLVEDAPIVAPAPADGDDVPGDTDVPVDGATEVPDIDDVAGGLLGAPVPETFEIFTARDPFQQLVVEAGEEGGQQVAADVPDGAVSDDDADRDDDADDGDSGTPAATPTQPTTTSDAGAGNEDGEAAAEGDDLTTQGQRPATPREIYDPQASTAGNTAVTLTAVSADGTEQVTVTIDEVDHVVTEGEVFADRFQLLDIDGRCATMLYGDSRFVICEGETIQK